MIKKFEEFVNEMYSPNSFKHGVFDFIDYLESIGVTDNNDRTEIYNIAVDNRNFYYTPEETENILKRLPGCDSIEGIIDVVKTVFFGTDEDLKEWCGNGKYPVVRGVNGKLLTGVVFYSEQFDKYAETEEDFEELLSEYATVELGILDDDLPDWIADNWEIANIYEVDLDKEYGWVEEK